MKKILSLLLSLVLVFSLVGCSTTGGENVQQDDSSIITSSYRAADSSAKNRYNPEARSSQQQNSPDTTDPQPSPDIKDIPIDKNGHYFDKENVALYINTFGCLPENFITKDQARDLGWEGGSVEKYAPGCAIGGDQFGNYEGLLPKAKGRVYYECDIDTDGYHSRGSRRIVFSNDGLIYYTHDHYESFELLYGEELI